MQGIKDAAVYCRVSSTNASAMSDGTSLEGQEEMYREYLDKLGGYRVVAVEAEQVSGTKLRRAGFDRILDLAEDRLIDVVVVAKVDRFARGRLVDAMLESALKELGVELLYVGRDTATPEGRLLVNIE